MAKTLLFIEINVASSDWVMRTPWFDGVYPADGSVMLSSVNYELEAKGFIIVSSRNTGISVYEVIVMSVVVRKNAIGPIAKDGSNVKPDAIES